MLFHSFCTAVGSGFLGVLGETGNFFVVVVVVVVVNGQMAKAALWSGAATSARTTENQTTRAIFIG